MTTKTDLPELLAPAGSQDSLRAALAAGADAVYFGGSEFSNRMRAKNFAGDSIRDAIKLCHSVGAAAHITVNTRVRDRELDDVLSFADTLLGGDEDSRADALIVADLGAAREIKKAYPHAVLHASTQTSMMSQDDCAALASLGFSRLVVPRELSLGEIVALVKSSPIEIEMFIHGAHCVSCSGQCLLSYVMGGRSGNRGECAQPCRLPYKMSTDCGTVGGNYPLSMADMYLGGHVTEIISSGVASLKIEGRLKNPSYVYGVTSIYRRLLDERRNASSAEKRALEELFTRGFSDGYLTTRYNTMSGIKSTEEQSGPSIKEINRALDERQRTFAAAKALENVRPITARFTMTAGTPAQLTLICGGTCGTALGDIPQPSTGSPITAESAAKNLVKLGGSGFSLSPDDIEFNIADGLWMPLSSINDLRRRALADLASKLSESGGQVQVCTDAAPSRTPIEFARAGKEKRDPEYTAEIANYGRFTRSGGDISAFADRFSRICVPLGDVSAALVKIPAEKLCAVLPMYSFPSLADELEKTRSLGVSRALCHTIGQVKTAVQAGLSADISFRGNITNTSAASVYADLGCASITLSPELTAAQARDICAATSADVGLIGYGRLPVMLLSRCIISGGACRKGNIGGRQTDGRAKPHSCSGELTDRLGEKFPVLSSPDCTNVIYNSTPIWMGDRRNELTLGGRASFVHFMFSTESLDDALDVITAYERGEKREGRRL